MTLHLRSIDATLLRPGDRPRGVLKAATLVSAGRARSVIERAHAEAERLLAAAGEQAERQMQQREHTLRQQLWHDAACHTRALQTEWDRALAELQHRIAQLVGDALQRLAQQIPPEERLQACVRQLLAQAGKPDGGLLLVGSDAAAASRALAGQLPWPVQHSDTLPAGGIRLVSAHGRWDCALDSLIDPLVAALQAAAAPHEDAAHA